MVEGGREVGRQVEREGERERRGEKRRKGLRVRGRGRPEVRWGCREHRGGGEHLRWSG